jgi:hypothetical protein
MLGPNLNQSTILCRPESDRKILTNVKRKMAKLNNFRGVMDVESRPWNRGIISRCAPSKH